MKEYMVTAKVVLVNNFKVRANSEKEALDRVKDVTQKTKAFLNNSDKMFIEFESFVVKDDKLRRGKLKNEVYEL